MLNYFEKNYREIILAFIEANHQVKGYRSSMAKASGFQVSYLSQVVAGSVHLTPDQAFALCDFWGLDAHSADYFMTQVNYERASSKMLKAHLQEKLDSIRTFLGSRSVKVTTNTPVEMEFIDAVEIFSSWDYLSVFEAMHIPTLKKAEDFAKFFNIELVRVNQILQKLESMGLVQCENGDWRQADDSKQKLILYNHSRLNQLFLNTLHSKAQSTPRIMNDIKSGAFISAISIPRYNEAVKELINFVQHIAARPDDPPATIVAGACLTLFRL